MVQRDPSICLYEFHLMQSGWQIAQGFHLSTKLIANKVTEVRFASDIALCLLPLLPPVAIVQEVIDFGAFFFDIVVRISAGIRPGRQQAQKIDIAPSSQ